MLCFYFDNSNVIQQQHMLNEWSSWKTLFVVPFGSFYGKCSFLMATFLINWWIKYLLHPTSLILLECIEAFKILTSESRVVFVWVSLWLCHPSLSFFRYMILPWQVAQSSSIEKQDHYDNNNSIFNKVGIMLHGKRNFCTKLSKIVKVRINAHVKILLQKNPSYFLLMTRCYFL